MRKRTSKIGKAKKFIIAHALLLILIIASATVVAAGVSIWNGTITWNAPIVRPTSTFTVTATLNGTAVLDPKNIALGTPYTDNSYIIIYKITSTATQPIVVTETNIITGATPTWNATSVSLPASGNIGFLKLTLSNIIAAGSISVTFTSTP